MRSSPGALRRPLPSRERAGVRGAAPAARPARPPARPLWGAQPPTPPSRTSTLRGSGPPTRPRISFLWGASPPTPPMGRRLRRGPRGRTEPPRPLRSPLSPRERVRENPPPLRPPNPSRERGGEGERAAATASRLRATARSPPSTTPHTTPQPQESPSGTSWVGVGGSPPCPNCPLTPREREPDRPRNGSFARVSSERGRRVRRSPSERESCQASRRLAQSTMRSAVGAACSRGRKWPAG